MKKASEVVACVADFGLYVPLGRRLAREFSKVYYFSPWESAGPKLKNDVIGGGYPEIQRTESIWEVKDECDLFVFPDIGYVAEQRELISQGKAVWGCGDAADLESNRGLFLKSLKEAGLSVPYFEAIRGVSNLKIYLRDKEDKYIKVSTWRGDFETFHWNSLLENETGLDSLAVEWGPFKESVVFYVFDPVKTEIEDGMDAWRINGQWPKTVLRGMENKDKSYLATFQKFDELPEAVRAVNEAFGTVLDKFGFAGKFSTEIRIKPDGEFFFIDPTPRFGSPPSQMECELIDNLGDIIWHGANGKMMEAEIAAQFGAQAVINLDRSDWAVIKLPEEIDRWAKFSYSCKQGGCVCIPPDEGGPTQIGWLVGIGDSIKEAIESLQEHAEQLPDGIEAEITSLAETLRKINDDEKGELEFTDDPVPPPSVVLETD